MQLKNKLADAENTYNYAIDKLIQWGYDISIANEMVDFHETFVWIAEKDKKKYFAVDPLRLLGFITIVREYGEDWNKLYLPDTYTIEPIPLTEEQIEIFKEFGR